MLSLVLADCYTLIWPAVSTQTSATTPAHWLDFRSHKNNMCNRSTCKRKQCIGLLDDMIGDQKQTLKSM